jgi:hypothetical protein
MQGETFLLLGEQHGLFGLGECLPASGLGAFHRRSLGSARSGNLLALIIVLVLLMIIMPIIAIMVAIVLLTGAFGGGILTGFRLFLGLLDGRQARRIERS